MSNINLEKYSPEEREHILKILKEVVTTGKSETYDEIQSADWKEVPVDIITFMKDPNYLGKGLIDGEGKFTVFPYWLDFLQKIFPDPTGPCLYNTIALTGSIGCGKSFVAVIIGLYEIYRMLCLKDPYVYYGLQPIDKITFAFINITLDSAKDVAWSKFQNLAKSSPWFLENGRITKSNDPEWYPSFESNIDLIVGSMPEHFLGRALFWCFEDEISFQRNQDIERQKEKAFRLVSEASARMQSRFMRGDYNPTVLVLASSKRTDQSFMEVFIEQKKQNDSKTTIVVDEPVWKIRGVKEDRGWFKLAVGNKFLPSEVLPKDSTQELEDMYRARGFRLLDVPLNYYESFIDDIDNALMTIAGISTTGSSSYISGTKVEACKVDTIHNPFTNDVLEIGDALDDRNQYYDFFDMNLVDKSMMNKPLYIHFDLSLSGDKTGIGGVWIKEKRYSTEENQGKELLFQLAFIVSIKAPKGQQVSFEKTRNFIYWLTEQGFNIKGITSDTFARAGIEQAFKSKGYNYEILSVDRVNTDRVCLPYAYLKTTIYEQRILLPKRGINLLTDELIGLKRDNNSGKVNHSSDGIDSKDSSDALAGATYNASLHSEEFSIDFAELADVSFSEEVLAAGVLIEPDFKETYEKMLIDVITKDLEAPSTYYFERGEEINDDDDFITIM